MACHPFFHILRFLHFENNGDTLNHDDTDYNRLWKRGTIFQTLNNIFCEMYYPTDRLSVEEVIVLYQERVAFQQYIPKKNKRFGN
jgi:hypothetical protein